ncbi:MAG: hypothetical protein IKP28_01460 [Clostridia bacterium]|nr:hypothetical protein [Clostridia bacterium]
MDLEKALRTVEIEPIRSLTFAEVGQIVQNFSQRLTLAFPNSELKLANVMEKMFECHMFLADIPDNLGNANYFYKTQAIYFKLNANFETLDDYIVHECIHYFQDIRDEKRELQRMGLCRFREFKIYNMALNEAAVQYITSKALESKKEEINYGGLTIKTTSPKYYPVLTSLMEQIAFLLGDDAVVESTLFSTDRFTFELMDVIGERNFNKIQSGFDKILEIRQTAYEDIAKQESLIANEYIKIQNILIQEYFKGALVFVETKDDANEYKRKIENFKDYIKDYDNLKTYEKIKEKQLEKLSKKTISINKAKMLTVVKHNIFIDLFRKLQEWIFSEEYKIKK